MVKEHLGGMVDGGAHGENNTKCLYAMYGVWDEEERTHRETGRQRKITSRLRVEVGGGVPPP